MSFFSRLKQDVLVSANNSSNANLGGGASFTGTSEGTLGINAVQVALKADQNCLVQIEQSINGSDWDIIDTLGYVIIKPGAWTVMAVASFVRVVVTNMNATTATTFFRLQTLLCPIANPLPNSLSDEGNLMVGVYEIEGDFATRVEVTPHSALRPVSPLRLVGGEFEQAFDTSFWTKTSQVGTGDSVVANCVNILSTGTTNASSIIVNSARVGRYASGTDNYFNGEIRLPAVTGINTRRWGAFNTNDGFFFEHDGTTLKVVTRKGGSPTSVSSGSFNGYMGATYVPGTNVHFYEINYTRDGVWFFIDNRLLHHIAATTATLTNEVALPVGLENTNGANINNNQLEVWSASIYRNGPISTQAQFLHLNALATTTLKKGPGNLQRVIINNVGSATDTLTLYDNTAASGLIIGIIPLGGTAIVVPVSLDYGGLSFNIGLTAVIASGVTPGDVTILFE